MKNQLKQKAAEIAALLSFPAPDELLNLTAAAGLDAIAATFSQRGGVTFPLSLATTGDKLSLLNAPDKLPVYLPAGLVQKLNAMGECIGLEDGAATFITEIISDDLADDNTHAADLIAEMWTVTDPEIIAELYRIQSGATGSPPEIEEDPELFHGDWDAFKAEKGLPPEMTHQEYRVAFVRAVAQCHGMNEDELIRDVILD